MSYFNAILVALLGFGLSPLLMGMDSWLPWGKKSSKNYLSEDVEKLMLFNMQEADLKGVAVPQDVKNIIVINGYKLYYDQLLEDESSWLNEHGGYANNFDLMTMNAEGRNFFKLLQQHNNFSGEQYNGIIKLPMGLKREKPLVNVVTYDYPLCVKIANSDAMFSNILIGGTLSGMVTGGIVLQTKFGSSMLTLPKVLTLSTIVAGGSGGLLLSICSVLKIVEMSKGHLVEKSILTPEEQRMIQKEKEAQEKAEQKARKKESAKYVSNILVKPMKMNQFERLEARKPDWFKKLNRE
jgi:hypothetical protein